MCLGNICRSPLAQGIFLQLAKKAGVADRFHVESAGLGSWHVGEPPDIRARQVARANGVMLTSRAQQFKPDDFKRFEAVLSLDTDVDYSLRRMGSTDEDRQKVVLLREYDPQADGDMNVPDPYYGGIRDFEKVYAMIERSCRELLRDMLQVT